jgi:uncharacterized protein YbcI
MPDVPSDPASELIAAADDEAREQRGTMRAALANAMVGMKKKYYGLGPTAARAWLLDDYVFVALEGGLTRNEQTLLDDGKQDIVRAYRLAFQETVRAPLTSAVAEIVGREVLDYHSQIVFDPPRTFEIFVLGAALPR